MIDTLPIFIGFDPREEIAADVCRHSVLKRASVPLYVRYLQQEGLRLAGLYKRQWEWRDGQRIDLIDERPFSTEFSFTRFLVPALQSYTGWAMFVDCDFLFLSDVAELIALADDSKAVMVCQQRHEPKESTKMDGAAQQRYWRKNWSSLMLLNCGHEANRALTPAAVNERDGSWLHQFWWLDEHEIGALPVEWNWIDGVTSGEPKAIHYSAGGPWFPAYTECAWAREWRDEYAQAARKAIRKEAA